MVICLYTCQSVLNLQNWGLVISAVNCGNFAAGIFMNVSDAVAVAIELDEVDKAGGCCWCRNIAFMSPRVVTPISLSPL